MNPGMVHVPAAQVGSRWYLPTGNVVEVLPSLVADHCYAVCKYTRRVTVSETESDAGVTLRLDFLQRWGKAL